MFELDLYVYLLAFISHRYKDNEVFDEYFFFNSSNAIQAQQCIITHSWCNETTNTTKKIQHHILGHLIPISTEKNSSSNK